MDTARRARPERAHARRKRRLAPRFQHRTRKKRQILLVALLVGSCVAFTGGIAFVGLIVPHIVRGLTGSNNRHVLPVSLLFGAALLLLADLIARTIIAPAELPIGILTAALVWRRLGNGGNT
ncbi:iron chelate uptake ABC transporter family permease subunit [uncultured Cardiobacterium sp.]|uniref:iron chelate uptake ABC transporter family permease subunit n=1 Tax=uncultured Cardiobacterium sp. TaxID=417619 RepID=UPI003453B951